VLKQLRFSGEIKLLVTASAKALCNAVVVIHAGKPNADYQDIRAFSIRLSVYAFTPKSPPDSA